MTVEDKDIPEGLVNPYRTAGRGAVVRGVTLGRVGAVTAGVIAVVAPADAPADAAVAGGETMHVVVAAGEVVFGTGDDVHNDVTEMSMPAGYLWPSPQLDRPPVSPALQL